MPPLLLDDDEAVAVAVGLRYAAGAAIGGMEESSLRALTKTRAHCCRIDCVDGYRRCIRVSVPMQWAANDDVVDPESLSVLAAACRDHAHVRFDYRRGDGESSRRLVEPHRLVTAGRRWYLVAWDHHRSDWRTFRLDRLSEPWLAGSHFTPREIPGGDAAGFVARSVGSPPRHHDAKLAIEATFADLAGVLRWIDHTPIEVAADRCLVQIRSEDLGRLAMTVARIALTAPVVVIEPTELADAVSRLALHLKVSPP